MHNHQYIPSNRPDYSVCSICGTYKSDKLLPRAELYEGGKYWTPEEGRSTMQEQVYNLMETETAGISKVGKMLGYMMEEGNVLEIGCAPGIFAKKAIQFGHLVDGVEPDEKNVELIKNIA